jgi:hypothetical protein
LKKTLARPVDFRPIEATDVRYLFAAYKDGALASMGAAFAQAGMSAAEFKQAFEAEVVERYAGAWTLFAMTRKGFIPVGCVLGFYSHPDPRLSPFMIVGDMLWFPWASARNRLEAAVNFFKVIRLTIPMVEYADDRAKPFFEVLARHGIVRRVGTMLSVYPDRQTAVFETTRKE